MSDERRYTRLGAGERLHIDVFCPKCGAEMTGLEFNRKNNGGGFIWESFGRCPECGSKIERRE